MIPGDPLILTLHLDKGAFVFFDTLRQRYFPPERNFLAAHLTLFHHLPSGEPRITDDLAEWSRTTAPLPLAVTGVRSIGRGVAFTIDCPQLVALHQQLQTRWKAWLHPQDRQKLWPHVTVQNKVPPETARATLGVLQASFRPFTAMGTGLDLWVYKGGPWAFGEGFRFKSC